jgi:predicted transposase/invertase (TIGR01784 family)
VQGYADPDFAKRMFQYYYRILDKYEKPITAFAIFADTNKTFHPKHYERNFLGTRVYYAFNTYKIIDQSEAELDASNNPFAMVVLSAKLALSRPALKDLQLFEQTYNLAKRLLNKQIPKEKIRKVMTFLRYYLSFENPEMFSKFVQELAILTERSTTMGIEEFLLDRAEKKGVEKSTKEIALKMKESGLDVMLISKITGLSVQEIENLK